MSTRQQGTIDPSLRPYLLKKPATVKRRMLQTLRELTCEDDRSEKTVSL